MHRAMCFLARCYESRAAEIISVKMIAKVIMHTSGPSFLRANFRVSMEYAGPWLVFGQQTDLLVKERGFMAVTSLSSTFLAYASTV